MDKVYVVTRKERGIRVAHPMFACATRPQAFAEIAELRAKPDAGRWTYAVQTLAFLRPTQES